MRVLLALLFFIVCLPANAYFVGWTEGLTNSLSVGYDDAGTWDKVSHPFYGTKVGPYEVPYPEPFLAEVLSESIVTDTGTATFYARTARQISKYKIGLTIGGNTGVMQDAVNNELELYGRPATIRVKGYSTYTHHSTGGNIIYNLSAIKVSGVVSPGGSVGIIQTLGGSATYCSDDESQWSNEWFYTNNTNEAVNFSEVIAGESYSAPCGEGEHSVNWGAITLHMYALDGDPTSNSYSSIYIQDDMVSGTDDLVDIDIQPNDPQNQVNTEGQFSDKMYVAIMGSNNFDATQVDAATLEFGPALAAPHKLPGDIFDANGDGYDDLKLMYRIGATGITCEHPESVELSGEKYDGGSFSGSDVVNTPDCPTSGCHP